LIENFRKERPDVKNRAFCIVIHQKALYLQLQIKFLKRMAKRIKEFPANPRRITDEALEQLGQSLIEFGSLDGFVVNTTQGKYKNAVISGNQKNKHVQLSGDNIVITERYEEPTGTGTVAVGYVLFNGERFPYREVAWDDQRCEVANIRANNMGGQNDADLLARFSQEVLDDAVILIQNTAK
jgi:hypothetical protein